MIIVIDGPAGSGKSSTAKAVAQKMHIEYLDSGALYRALTWLYIKSGEEKKAFVESLEQASISFSYSDELFRVKVNGNEITDYLRTNAVADLGTAVFPDAELKFFMVADVDERARRRFKELKAAGTDLTLDEVRRNIRHRDQQDSSREADPLKKAPDAIEINTTDMDFDEQVNHICSIIDDQTELIYK